MRNKLLAAIAAFPFANTDAPAADVQPALSSWSGKANVVKPNSAVAKKKLDSKPAKASERERALLNTFSALLLTMQGAHLVSSGDLMNFPAYEEFCKDLEIFCQKFTDHRENEPYEYIFTPKLFEKIHNINTSVNGKVKQQEDLLQYGIEEKWTIPGDAGDCEDFVLLKMLELLYAGLPPTALHILVVRDEKKEGHAVLGVDILENGEWNTLILDNKTNAIITLDAMEKRYKGSLASFVTEINGRIFVKFYNFVSRASQRTR